VQTYGLGIKEIWRLDPAKHFPGRVTHTTGCAINAPAKSAGSVASESAAEVGYLEQ
jgi:electron-transferring-flavoprotein dehydrogenase